MTPASFPGGSGSGIRTRIGSRGYYYVTITLPRMRKAYTLPGDGRMRKAYTLPGDGLLT